MRYHFYAEQPEYPVALLVGQISANDMRQAYFDGSDIDAEDVMVLTLHYVQGKKKTPAAEMKLYIKEQLQPVLDDYKTTYILCTDGNYFKTLTGASNVDASVGYVLDSKFGPQKVVYIPSHRTIFYDPAGVKTKIARGIQALIDHVSGTYKSPGHGIIKFAEYPQTDEEIDVWLNKLLEMDCPLTIDIETFDLKHYFAGIGTISFAWNQGEGIAFPVDYVEIEGATEAPFGLQGRNLKRREMLRRFFEAYWQKAIYHNIAFDVYVMIYQLFMRDIIDIDGFLYGQQVMLRDWDCTKLITYLATNSCAGNELGLKKQAQEFAGNYAQSEIHDITRIPLAQLLEYNLVDGLSTWHVHNKNYPKMILDEQSEVYEGLFKSATVDIIQMQLTGMPVNIKQVGEVEEILQKVFDTSESVINGSSVVTNYNHRLADKYVEKKNAEYKKKRITLADVPADIVFNPRSAPQLQDLLFAQLGLPILALTDTKLPATDGDTIQALVHHAKDPYIKDFLSALLDFKAVEKILGTFIKALKNSRMGPDGWHYLFGNFNLGGTLSGRLSSSDPNLQNLPANVMMAIAQALIDFFGDRLKPFIVKGKLHLGKMIKSCFEAPPGWLFVGLDFASLEDRISALTTKDPNKIKVYTDGYDGHCLRAQAYFGEDMPDIDPTSVASINSIETKYKDYRQDSKAPTFALTYQGTWATLVKNCGFSEEKAKSVEAKYHDLYVVSDQWVQSKLDEAAKVGYVTVAFGLRVRTPLLHQVIRGNSKTPHQAEAEGRSAGNALGQSYCLLNSRAASEFMGKVRNSQYKHDIRPCAQIHDASYYIIREDIGAVLFTNEHLVKAVQWQEDPLIQHDQVKLGGEVSIFYPTWAKEITIPNGADEQELLSVIDAALA